VPDPTDRFDPAAYGPAIAAVLGDGRKLLPLARGPAAGAFRPAIVSLDVPPAVRAGLWAYHDFWDEAHEVAQDIDTPDGSVWHAILHRREPDGWNSNYWWRRVGGHPVLAELRRDAEELGFADFTPERLVAACGRGDGVATLQRVQLREWQLLFDWCARGHDSA
jgi:hypothetical protein